MSNQQWKPQISILLFIKGHSKYTSMDHFDFDYSAKLHYTKFPSRLHIGYYSSSEQKDRRETLSMNVNLIASLMKQTSKKALAWPEVGRVKQKGLERLCPLIIHPPAVFLLPKDFLYSLKTIFCLAIISTHTRKTEPPRGKLSIGCEGRGTSTALTGPWCQQTAPP